MNMPELKFLGCISVLLTKFISTKIVTYFVSAHFSGINSIATMAATAAVSLVAGTTRALLPQGCTKIFSERQVIEL